MAERDHLGNTRAMILAAKGIIPPVEHDPALKNGDGFTVAMLLVRHGKEVPVGWRHDPIIGDDYNRSIAFYYINKK